MSVTRVLVLGNSSSLSVSLCKVAAIIYESDQTVPVIPYHKSTQDMSAVCGAGLPFRVSDLPTNINGTGMTWVESGHI